MNKLFFRFSLLFLISGIGFVSCSKEEITKPVEILEEVSDVNLISYNDGSRSLIYLLEFQNREHFENTIEKLRKESKKLDSDFLRKYSKLDELSINFKQEEIGFDEFENLKNFDLKIGFKNSMWQSYIALEKQWMDSGLKSEQDPNILFPFEPYEMALLNTAGEVKIGKSIIKLTNQGYIEILDSDFQKLVKYNNGDRKILEDRKVKSMLGSEFRGEDCRGWAHENFHHSYATDRKVNKYLHFNSYPWYGASKARMSSYAFRRSWWGGKKKWYRHRMWLEIRNTSSFRDIDCDPAGGGLSLDKEFSSWIDARVFVGDAFPQYRAENGASVNGLFKYAGNSTTHNLSW